MHLIDPEYPYVLTHEAKQKCIKTYTVFLLDINQEISSLNKILKVTKQQ